MNYVFPGAQITNNSARENIVLSDIFSLLWRNAKLISLTAAVCVALGVLAIILLPKKYEASALVLIDPRQIDILADKAATDARLLTTDSLVVDSEVEILNSRELLKRVADRANIYNDPEYSKASPIREMIRPLIKLVSDLFGNDTSSGGDQKSMILSAFARNISVERVGPTYVLQITYESESPARAAQVANIITDEYLSDGLRVQSEGAQRSSAWLKQRLTALQKEVIAADRAVEVYKMENDLVSTQAGGLVTEQQVAEISSRLVSAQADEQQAKARLDAARGILASGNFATLSGGGSTDLVAKLLSDRQIEEQDGAKIFAVYGKSHLAYQKSQDRIAEIDRQIRVELERVTKGYEADYQAAKQVEDSLNTRLAEFKRAALEGGEREVRLRELEQQALASKAIYQSMLEAFNKAMQQRSIPTETARVIQSADPPPKWTSPNWKILGALSLMVGLGCGVGGALLREGLKSSVHSSREIEDITGRPNIGIIPAIAKLGKHSRQLPSEPSRLSIAVPPEWEELVIPEPALAGYHAILADEGSIILDTLRSMEVAARIPLHGEIHEGAVVMALGSALAGEGKSTVSALFALHLAMSGARVLLVDYDFQRGGLTERFRRPVPEDLASAQTGPQPRQDMMWDPVTGLVFMPAPGRKNAGREISRVIADGTERHIHSLRGSFDFIVLDLPPLFHLPQGRMLAKEIDKFFLVVEWGKANVRVLERSLVQIPEITRMLAGTIMNKTQIKQSIGYEKLEYY